MARLDLVPKTPSGPFPTLPLAADSADVVPIAQSTPGDGWAISGNGRKTMILVHNTNAAPQTITVISVARNGRTGDITTYSIGIDELAMFGPFDPVGWNQSDGRVHIDGSDALVLVAAIDLPLNLFR